MALKTRVLVSSISNLSDARYCAGMGVEMMGFNFNINDPEHISVEAFKEIAGWVTGVAYVGEFGNSSPEDIFNIADDLGLDYLEVENPLLIASLKSLRIPLILKINVQRYENSAALGQILNDYDNSVAYFNLYDNENISQEYWLKITEYMMSYPIILGFNITKENINYLIESTKLKGISLMGGHEIKRGYKDFDELAEIIEAIEIDDTV